MKVKFLLVFMPIFAFNCFANESEHFSHRLNEYLKKKYTKILNKAEEKLGVSSDVLKEKVSSNLKDETLSFLGHVNSQYGTCRIEGFLKLMDQSSRAICISDNGSAKIIFL